METKEDFKRAAGWLYDNQTLRMYKSVNETSGCWEWTGSLRKDGYGGAYSQYTQKTGPAHRLSYQHFKMVLIPKGSVVRHACDNPKCYNPDHLILGTQLENMADMVDRDRLGGACQKGEKSPFAKLKLRQVMEITKLVRTPANVLFASKKYKVCTKAIENILDGRTWSHATGITPRWPTAVQKLKLGL